MSALVRTAGSPRGASVGALELCACAPAASARPRPTPRKTVLIILCSVSGERHADRFSLERLSLDFPSTQRALALAVDLVAVLVAALGAVATFTPWAEAIS